MPAAMTSRAKDEEDHFKDLMRGANIPLGRYIDFKKNHIGTSPPMVSCIPTVLRWPVMRSKSNTGQGASLCLRVSAPAAATCNPVRPTVGIRLDSARLDRS